ncbi:MAG: PD-(D/E)XK nuclease domain-containing protein, partial [Bacteroidales bacterium]|nr:PD-(D/E)XK nuclease domain-containing protein [Bacteroidales bacterium]
PNDLSNKTEKDDQTIFYLLFTLMGQFVQTEVKSAVGRADAVVMLPDTIYVFEFKLSENASAEDALKQIDAKGYLIPYSAGERKVIKIGAEFSRTQRTLSRWVNG